MEEKRRRRRKTRSSAVEFFLFFLFSVKHSLVLSVSLSCCSYLRPLSLGGAAVVQSLACLCPLALPFLLSAL